MDFAYGRVPVFHRLSLDIPEGSMTALLGPNGSGKTTWVRLASGSLRPDSGRVMLRGEDLARLPARVRARALAVVPQDSSPSFDYTVREVVTMGRAPHLGLLGIPSGEDGRIVDEALSSTDTAGLAARAFRSLSGGERQRVLVARALAQQPSVLLLDEPTAFLDLRHRLAVYRILARLHQECGLTIVVVSHDVNLAARHCRRLVLLRQGAIAADGPPAAVLRPETLRSTYGVEVTILRDPDTGGPLVVPTGPSTEGS